MEKNNRKPIKNVLIELLMPTIIKKTKEEKNPLKMVKPSTSRIVSEFMCVCVLFQVVDFCK